MIAIDFSKKDIIYDYTSLYQWDYGQKLYIIGLNISADVQVHFAREGQQAEIRIGTYSENAITVPIPDYILQREGKFKAYIYFTDADSGQTIKVAYFNVKARERPTDYTTGPYEDIVKELNNKLNHIIETGIAEYEPDPVFVENLVNAQLDRRLGNLGSLAEKDEVAKTDLTIALANEIDGKLNANKIINNLATTEEGFVLDARQGKVLNDAVSTLNNNLTNVINSRLFQGVIIPNNDCNQAIASGYYLTDVNTVNIPTGWAAGRKLLIVFNIGNNAYAVQQIFEYGTGKFATRVGVTQPWVDRS